MQRRRLNTLLNESERKKIDLILEYFNLEWEQIKHQATRKRVDFNKPNGIAKFTVMVYLDYIGITPAEIKDLLGYTTLGVNHIESAKKRVLKNKTIQHLYFELLNLDYEKFIKRSEVFYETFN